MSAVFGSLIAEVVTDGDRWDAFVEQHPNSHHLQSWAWGRFKAEQGWSTTPLFWRRSDQTEPMAATFVHERRLSPLPLTMLYLPGGPIVDFDSPADREDLLTALALWARRQRALLLRIDPTVVVARGEVEAVPTPAGEAWQASLRQHGWQLATEQWQFAATGLLSLAPDEDALLAAMKQKTRYNIRLAGRKAVTVRVGGRTDLALFSELYAATAERDGFPLREMAYYEAAWAQFLSAGQAELLIAEFEQRPLAAVFIIHYGRRAIYMYGASADDERRRMPNYLLQWEAIRRARLAGRELYDFWGAPTVFDESDPLWGVWRFKAGFNAEAVRFLGAWDLPLRPRWHQLYTYFMPRYRQLRRRSQENS